MSVVPLAMWSSTRCATDWSSIAVFISVPRVGQRSLGRPSYKAKETVGAWREPRSTGRQLGRQPALEGAQRLVALLLGAMHQPIGARRIPLRHRPTQPALRFPFGE